ncbi:hypothetical protein [Armatimonas sp.]|uniref:hypothetical protein n=1 Tax=Armatimonas sp. TaxID=1872638 RepID=UPI00375223C6
MRPKIFTFRSFLLALAALGILGGLAFWGYRGFPLPFVGVPSTAGKIAFVWEKDGQSDIYLASATGGEPTQLTRDTTLEGELAFSADGQRLVFTEDHGQSGVRQVCLTEAAPGRRQITLTVNESTKEQPYFRGDRDLFFLDSGKIGRTTTDASDSDAIFPTVEGKRDNVALAALFAEGGISQYAVSQDGETILAAVKREHGHLLVVYQVQDKFLALLGSSQDLRFQALKDGSFVVLFTGGAPLKEAMQIPNPKTEEEKQMASEQMGKLLNQMSSQNDVMEGKSVLVHFDAKLTPQSIIPLPFIADGFCVAPDSKLLAIYISEARDGKSTGLFVGNITAQDPPTLLYNKPVRAVTWSPDSASLAFVADKELLVTPATGTDTPINLTQGKGKASSPVWSPIQVKK